jgi:hypothetical protein
MSMPTIEEMRLELLVAGDASSLSPEEVRSLWIDQAPARAFVAKYKLRQGTGNLADKLGVTWHLDEALAKEAE